MSPLALSGKPWPILYLIVGLAITQGIETPTGTYQGAWTLGSSSNLKMVTCNGCVTYV